MRERIKQIIAEVTENKNNLEHITKLISHDYIDSFEILLLINTLEKEFGVKFNLSSDLLTNFESIDKIEELMRSKTNSPQKEWEQEYGSNSIWQKNKYPHTEIVTFVMNNFSNVKKREFIKILDLGCGWGNNLSFLKNEGFDYFGIDFSPSAVKHCQKHFKNVILGDISQLPYKDDFFDCIFDRTSIQHNPKEKIAKIIKEVHRTLKVNGIFYSTLITKGNYKFYTTYLTEEEIKQFTSSFKEIEINRTEKTNNNQQEIWKSYNLNARK